MTRYAILTALESSMIDVDYVCTVGSCCPAEYAFPLVEEGEHVYEGEAACADHIGMRHVVGVQYRGRS